MNIGFIGGGKMAEAIIRGIVKKKLAHPPEILISDIDKKRLNYFESDGFKVLIVDKRFVVDTTDNNDKVARLSDIVILAVKPQNAPNVIQGIQINEDKLLISIAAGISIKYLEEAFPRVAVIRAMPNNPALVGAGITALAKGHRVKKEQLADAKAIFASVGEVVEVKENLMDAVTGLSGSGPAFIYLAMEALTAGGVAAGLSKRIAMKLAFHTVLGAAMAVKETGKTPGNLREMVTSPGGTTIEGLKVLQKERFFIALQNAVAAAAKKSKYLSKKWSR
jgi:pyrroline-5-carboxylate reductase